MLFKCILGLPQDSIRGVYQLGLSWWLSGKKKKRKRKNSPANVGDLDLIPWRRKWQPTPVFCLENPKDRGAWQATVYGVTKSRHNLPTKQQQKPAFL